jgi:hypothetical protein
VTGVSSRRHALPNPIQKRKEVKPMIDDFFDLGFEAMALLGSLAEELAEEKIERLKRKQEMEQEDCEPCCEESDPCDPTDDPLDPPDEDPYP